MRIKLFESFHGKTPNILTYFEAENELSDKDGFAIVGITGNMEDVERVIKKFIAGTELPESTFDDASIVITDQSSTNAKGWKSDALIPFNGKPQLDINPNLYQYIKKENAIALEKYFGKDSWTVKKESVNEGGELNIVLDGDDFYNLITGKEVKTKTLHAGPDYRIILSDIGYSQMAEMLKKAVAEHRAAPQFGSDALRRSEKNKDAWDRDDK